MDILSMTTDELLEESRRRLSRRAENKPLAPDPVEPRAEEIDTRLEKNIQADVRKRYMALGCRVWNLSQARASKQSAGLGDLYVISERAGQAWWHETKTPTGLQSEEQLEFMVLNQVAGVTVIVGGVRACEEQLIRIGLAQRINGALEPTGRRADADAECK